MRTQTSRRGKMAFVTLDDGAGSRGDRRVQRDASTPRAHLLREDQLVIVEAQGDAARRRGRPGAGSARRRRSRLRSRGDPPALCEGASPRVQRRGRRRAARRAHRRRSGTARVRSSSNIATTASAASSSCPTRGASTSTIRCSRGCATGSRRRTCGWCIERPLMSRARRAWRARRGLWRHREFLLLWSAQGRLRDRLAHHAHRASDRSDPRCRRRRDRPRLADRRADASRRGSRVDRRRMGRPPSPPPADDRRRPRPRSDAAVDSRRGALRRGHAARSCTRWPS